jgi:FAD/FMN-containing dehydrogenase
MSSDTFDKSSAPETSNGVESAEVAADPNQGPAGTVRIRNWAMTLEADVVAVHKPATKAELVELLRRTNGPLRMGGARHSWSSGVMTKGGVVDMRGMNRVLSIDAAKEIVTVEAGIRMQDLYERLDAEGFALPSLPSSAQITLGGAMANAVHGSGFKYPATVADAAVELTLIKSDGSGEVTVKEGTRFVDSNEVTDLQLARVHLGALGALYSAALKIIPRYDLKIEEKTITLEEGFGEQLHRVAQQNDHHLFFWFPELNQVRAKLMNRIEPLQDPGQAQQLHGARYVTDAPSIEYDPKQQDEVLDLARNGRTQELHIPVTSKPPETMVTSWHVGPREKATLRRHGDLAYGVPIDRLEATMKALKRMFAETAPPVMPMWIRLVGRADSAMATAFDRPEAKMEFYPMLDVGTEAERRTQLEQASEIFLQNGGKRHWAKQGIGGVSSLSPNRVSAFQRLRSVMDPANRLRNEYSDEIGLTS